MNANLAAVLYLVAGVLFILALRGLSSPASSRRGNLLGMVGMAIAIVTTLAAHPPASPAAWALVVLGMGLGGGLGAVGAGVGIGLVWGKVIEGITRQPEMREEITQLQWLGFALTEACFFYGLVAGLIAGFVL